MSNVKKSQRSEPVNGFIVHMTKTRKRAYDLFKKYPRYYHGGVLDTAKRLVNDAFLLVHTGNSIFLGSGTTPDDFRLRRSLMIHGRARWEAFGRELAFLRDLADEGTNFLGRKAEYDPLFDELGKGVNTTVESIGRVISKNKLYWEKHHGPLAEWMCEPMKVETTNPVEVLESIDFDL